MNSEMRWLSTPLPSITAFFCGVEGGGIILEVHDHRARLWALIENLGLAFIDARAPAVHGENPQSYSVELQTNIWGQLVGDSMIPRSTPVESGLLGAIIAAHKQFLALTSERVVP